MGSTRRRFTGEYKAHAVALTGPDGLLGQLTKTVPETAQHAASALQHLPEMLARLLRIRE